MKNIEQSSQPSTSKNMMEKVHDSLPEELNWHLMVAMILGVNIEEDTIE